MKLRSEKGRFILLDGGKRCVFDNVLQAMCYMFIMTVFRKIPYIGPPLSPVRAITPNPKPITLTLEDKIKISRIKASIPVIKI